MRKLRLGKVKWCVQDDLASSRGVIQTHVTLLTLNHDTSAVHKSRSHVPKLLRMKASIWTLPFLPQLPGFFLISISLPW